MVFTSFILSRTESKMLKSKNTTDSPRSQSKISYLSDLIAVVAPNNSYQKVEMLVDEMQLSKFTKYNAKMKINSKCPLISVKIL